MEPISISYEFQKKKKKKKKKKREKGAEGVLEHIIAETSLLGGRKQALKSQRHREPTSDIT